MYCNAGGWRTTIPSARCHGFVVEADKIGRYQRHRVDGRAGEEGSTSRWRSRAVCQLKGTGVCGSMAYPGDGSGVGESSCGRSEGASMMNAGVCFIKPTPAMIEEEKDLAQRGVVAVFQKSRSPQESRVRAGDSRRAIDSEFHIKDYGLSVVSTYPADFLIKSGPILHEKILQKGSVKGLDFLLSVKPWSRHLYCKKSMFDVKVVIEVSGVPEHAWDTDIVEDLLSPFCSVLSVCRPYYFYPKFIIQALAHGVDAIPAGRSLAIGEPVFSNRLEDACLGTNWPNKVCTYLVVFETKLHEPTNRELDGDSSIDSGYGYDTDREPMGW